ncbi:MYND-type domain-containing protein [Mycena venus]|uniref:MYND-type domain-containing protein n=1 Tax=Mycena venus TaxID=2733690 RepID=A0A8H6YT65_9AGAR|nr:MYND-type domain-containing protein [Mycena venus]
MAPLNPQKTAPKPGPGLSKREKRDLEDRLISSLRREPGALCIVGIANCCDKIFHPPTFPRSNRVLRAAMRFLCGDRTLPEHHLMTRSIARCHCDLNDPLVASLHESVSNIDALNYTILEMAFAIMDALDPRPKDAPIPDDSGKDLDQVVLGMTKWEDLMEDEDQLGPLPADWVIPDEFRSQFKAPEPELEPELEPDEDTWPSSPEEVFPSTKGLAKTLENLLLWTGEPCGGSGVFLLISHLSEYAPSFAEEIHRSQIAMPCALVHLEQALDRFKDKQPPNTFRLAIAAVTHFLHQLPKRRFLLLLTAYRDILLDLAIDIQPALARMPGAEAASAKAWWASVRMGLDAGPAFPWDKFGRPEPRKPMFVNSMQLYRMMRVHRAQNFCMKLGCDKETNPPKALMFCRRCALACYCDAACQKQAWGKGEAPHKRLCNEVDALRRGIGLESDPQWKDVLTRRTEGITKPENIFAEICKAKEVDGMRLQSIADLLIQHGAAMHQ